MTDKNSCYENFCQKQPLLLTHLEAVLQHNRITNLTSIKDIEAGKVLHIEDSLAVLPELEKAPEGPLLDLGSGAGYPGIPLALFTGRQTTLLEANKKKAAFLQSFIEAHDLSDQIQVVALRSEEFALKERGRFAVVTVRAVAELPVLLELSAPLLVTDGYLIALKGNPDSNEIERGDLAAKQIGMCLLNTRSYMLSDNASKRCVLVYTKTSDSTVDLPRRPGMATKRPLS